MTRSLRYSSFFPLPVSLFLPGCWSRAVTKQPMLWVCRVSSFWPGVGWGAWLLSSTEMSWPSCRYVDVLVPHSQRLVLRGLRLVPQVVLFLRSPPCKRGCGCRNQTGNLAWVKAVQKTQTQVCTWLCFLIWFRTAPPAMPGLEQEVTALFLGTAGAYASSPLAAMRPLLPRAAHCSVLPTQGRGRDLYFHGGGFQGCVVLEDCQAPP